jgi:hypothetical protein
MTLKEIMTILIWIIVFAMLFVAIYFALKKMGIT